MQENDKQYLQEQQYKNPDNYQTRLTLIDYADEKIDIWAWRARPFNFNNAKDILEIGCGPGHLWEQASKKLTAVQHLVLTDFSDGMLEAARAHLASLNLPCAVQFKNADMENLPYSAASFDAVIAQFVIYHADSPAQALSEIKRVLKPTGWASIVTIIPNSFHDFLKLAHEIDNRIPPYSISAPFAENIADAMLPKFFPRIEKDTCKINVTCNESTPILNYIRAYPTVQKLALSEEFYAEYEKRVNALFQKDGAIKSEFGMASYMCYLS